MENTSRLLMMSWIAFNTLASSQWTVFSQADARAVPDTLATKQSLQENNEINTLNESEARNSKGSSSPQIETTMRKMFEVRGPLLLHLDKEIPHTKETREGKRFQKYEEESSVRTRRLGRTINNQIKQDDFPDEVLTQSSNHDEHLLRRRTIHIPSLDVAALHRQHKEHFQILRDHQEALRHQQQLLQQRLKQNLKDTSRILLGKKPHHVTPNYFSDRIDLNEAPLATSTHSYPSISTEPTTPVGNSEESVTKLLPNRVTPQETRTKTAETSTTAAVPGPSLKINSMETTTTVPEVSGKKNQEEILETPADGDITSRITTETALSNGSQETRKNEIPSVIVSSTAQHVSADLYKHKATTPLQPLLKNYQVTETPDDILPPTPPTVFGLFPGPPKGPGPEGLLNPNRTSDTLILEAVKGHVASFINGEGTNDEQDEELGSYLLHDQTPIDDIIIPTESANAVLLGQKEQQILDFPTEINDNSETAMTPEVTESFEILETPQWAAESEYDESSTNDSKHSSPDKEPKGVPTFTDPTSLPEEVVPSADIRVDDTDELLERPSAVDNDSDIDARNASNNMTNEEVHSLNSSNTPRDDSGEHVKIERKVDEHVTGNEFQPHRTPSIVGTTNAPNTERLRSDLSIKEGLSESNISYFTAEHMLQIIPVIVERLRAGKLDAKDQQLLAEAYGEYWPGIVELSDQTNADAKQLLQEFETWGPRPPISRSARVSAGSDVDCLDQGSSEVKSRPRQNKSLGHENVYETFEEFINPEISQDYAYEGDAHLQLNPMYRSFTNMRSKERVN